MPTIQSSIEVLCSVDELYRYLCEPNNYMTICGNFTEISDIQHTASNTTRFYWRYKLAGVHFEGFANLIQTISMHKIRISFWGGIHGEWLWQIHTKPDGVQVSLEVEYGLPIALSKQRQASVIDETREGIERILENLKLSVVKHIDPEHKNLQ